MFSQTVEYALRAVVFLACRETAPETGDAVARATQIPRDYLSKVMQCLVRGGIVRAQRGKNGGFVLARPATQLSVLDVVQVVDPIRRIRTCPLGLAAHGTQLCSLHSKLDGALQTIEQAFGETTIAALLAEPSPVKPLCEITGFGHAA